MSPKCYQFSIPIRPLSGAPDPMHPTVGPSVSGKSPCVRKTWHFAAISVENLENSTRSGNFLYKIYRGGSASHVTCYVADFSFAFIFAG